MWTVGPYLKNCDPLKIEKDKYNLFEIKRID